MLGGESRSGLSAHVSQDWSCILKAEYPPLRQPGLWCANSLVTWPRGRPGPVHVLVMGSLEPSQRLGGARIDVFKKPTAVGFGVMGGSHAESNVGVSLMRITIDTREDSYEDALAVLRRAYGRHRLPRRSQESPAVSEVVVLSSGGTVAEESDNWSATGAGRGGAGLRKPPVKATTRAAANRSPATKAAAESPGPKSGDNRASGRKAARNASARGRLAAPQKHSASSAAANTAPRGQSEAVRAWAQAQGMQVRRRGRMPAKVISAYLEAHKD